MSGDPALGSDAALKASAGVSLRKCAPSLRPAIPLCGITSPHRREGPCENRRPKWGFRRPAFFRTTAILAAGSSFTRAGPIEVPGVPIPRYARLLPPSTAFGAIVLDTRRALVIA
jgi:hypothetical protein